MYRSETQRPTKAPTMPTTDPYILAANLRLPVHGYFSHVRVRDESGLVCLCWIITKSPMTGDEFLHSDADITNVCRVLPAVARILRTANGTLNQRCLSPAVVLSSAKYSRTAAHVHA